MTFDRILIAIDGSDCSIDAAKVGFELAATLHADVATLLVVEPAVPSSGDLALSAEEWLQVSSQDDQSVRAKLRSAVVVPDSVSHVVKTGRPAEVIEHYAKSWRADLIVVGSHGRSGVSRILIGSVAEAVVRHAPCPVLVVRKTGRNAR